MKYRIENQLDIFEFHDAEMSFISFENNRLAVTAKHLNIHKNTENNPCDFDMEIDSAIISFDGFEVCSLEPMRAYEIDDEGNYYTNEKQIIYKGKEAKDRFLTALKNWIGINCIDIREENNKKIIEFSVSSPDAFISKISFDKATFEWDEYCRKAWYELHRQYHEIIALQTPEGDIKTDMHIVYHEEDMYYNGELEAAPIINIGVTYKGKEIRAHGKDHLLAKVIADIQKQLPEDVLIKCCLTCRHGNMCPFSNYAEEIFCTKDLVISSKNDVCGLFGDSYPEHLVMKYTDACQDYKPQSNEHYTYNDYLYCFDNE